MATTDVASLTLFDEYPEHALHLHDGWWTADCADCGCTVASGQHQQQVERAAHRIPCPVCHPSPA